MADVKALSILSEQIKSFQKVQNIPRNLDAVDSYSAQVKEVSNEAQKAVAGIKSYIEQVEKKIVDLRKEQQILIKKNQDAIQEIFNNLKSNAISESVSLGKGTGWKHVEGNKIAEFEGGAIPNSKRHSSSQALEELQRAHKLQEIAKETINNRLGELMKETENVCSKLKDCMDLSNNDIDKLNGCFQSWKNAKAASFEDEQRAIKMKKAKDKHEKKEREEQKRAGEEARNQRRKQDVESKERNQREQAKINQKEEELRNRQKAKKAEHRVEEDRKKREKVKGNKVEEELRKKQEAEEAERNAEEAKNQREEAERNRIEEEKQQEEERINREEEMEREEEERKRKEKEEEEAVRKREEKERKHKEKEEEAIRKREEDERKHKEKEEEAVRKREEEERQRLEAEKKETEDRDRAWRQDPNNWNNVTYNRDDDVVSGRRAYHGGIKCIISSPPSTIEKDDIECTASDEVDSVIETLNTDEKPVSSTIDIHSRKGNLHFEVPTRIYIPHYSALSSDDETVVKMSLNQNSWVTVPTVPSTSNIQEQEKMVQGMVCFEVNDFTRLKVIIVTRPRCQSIIVDKPGISIYSTMERKVHLHVPRYTFGSRTELKLMVQAVSEKALGTFVNDNKDLHNILSVSSVVTLVCGKQPTKSIEVDMNSSQKEIRAKVQRGNTYQLYSCMDKAWKFADIEVKGHQDDITVVLPSGQEKYTIMELDVPSTFPRESVPSMAAALKTCINKTVVVFIIKQHKDDLNSCAVRVVKKENGLNTLALLAENGFTEGPDASPEFILHEGQELEFNYSGNIENRTEKDEHKFRYISYMGGVATDVTLQVKDSWKQKDLPAYVGSIRCTVLNKSVHSEILCRHAAELKISLPKQVRRQETISVARVRVPFYLITLASYLCHNLCVDDNGMWENVLKSLLGSSDFSSAYRNARRKTVAKDEESICKTMLLDWMKAQAIHVDKLGPITVALKYNGHDTLSDACIDFVRVQKENLTDNLLSELAQRITKNVHALGKDLGLDNTEIERCIKQHPNDIKKQYLAEMKEWRESDRAIKHRDNALEYLRNICV